MAKRRFRSQKSAEAFARAVNGKINDLRDTPEAKAEFSVTYIRDLRRARQFRLEHPSNWSLKELDKHYNF